MTISQNQTFVQSIREHWKSISGVIGGIASIVSIITVFRNAFAEDADHDILESLHKYGGLQSEPELSGRTNLSAAKIAYRLESLRQRDKVVDDYKRNSEGELRRVWSLNPISKRSF
ncbi:MAG: hypothetical protein ABSF97_07585 [Candidatus Sulfotelmatobacter sp.]